MDSDKRIEVFAGGLPRDVTGEILQEDFGMYNEVIEPVVMISGFGFILFSVFSVVEAVIRHERSIDVSILLKLKCSKYF